MKFTPGDKVSFINEKQNGIVIKAFEGGKVIVEIEDGFEIEVFEKELVKTGRSAMDETTLLKPEVLPIVEEHPAELLSLCQKGSVCFAGVPSATGAVLTGMVRYYLLNNSEYDLAYTFFRKQKNKNQGITRGISERQSEILLAEYRRSDLTETEAFLFEALFYYTESRPSITHIRKDLAVLLPGISNTNEGLTGVAAFAKTAEIFNDHIPEPEVMKDLVEKLGTRHTEVFLKQSKRVSKQTDSHKYGIYINEKEVDLHIEELQPDFFNLTNSEMVAIQLKHFSQEMDNAIRNQFKRIIFIHGVGNGVLKKELRNELRKYDGISVRDGDFAKYGYGATEVLFV